MATMQEKLKAKIEEIPDRKLAIFTVSCHVDRPLETEVPESKYEIPIQAGAALTDKRTQDINDFDDVADTISDKNSVYSEMSAAYWVWKNVDLPYLGLDHYRRRFKVSDEQLDAWIAEGVDVISTVPTDRQRSLREEYEIFHFGKDWQIMEEVFQSLYPEDYIKAQPYMEKSCMHCCCMGIFRKEIFDDCCQWIFSILDRVYDMRVEKVDKYQHRDVSFLAERLMSIYVDIHKDEWNYKEVSINTISSTLWQAKNECNLSDADDVLQTIKRLLAERRIDQSYHIINGAKVHSDKTVELKQIIYIYILERNKLINTMFERHPEFCDYEKLVSYFRNLDTLLKQYAISMNEEGSEDGLIKLFQDCISSYCFLHWIEYYDDLCKEEYLNNLAAAFMDADLIRESVTLLNMALKRFPDSDITFFNFAFLAAKIGDKAGAILYLDKIKQQQDDMVIELRNYVMTM